MHRGFGPLENRDEVLHFHAARSLEQYSPARKRICLEGMPEAVHEGKGSVTGRMGSKVGSDNPTFDAAFSRHISNKLVPFGGMITQLFHVP